MKRFNLQQLFSDIIADKIPGGSRTVITDSGIKFIFLWNVTGNHRETCIQISEIESKTSFPQWKGISIDTTQNLSIGGTQSRDAYAVLKQVPEHDPDGKKYETIISNVLASLNSVPLLKSSTCIKRVLVTWKEFFSSNDENKPGVEKQQGLFGELLFLKSLIQSYGSTAVYWWQGPSGLSHDFVTGTGVTVEVKTTRKNAPYSVKISNEYQLDSNDESGEKLFLAVYPVEPNYEEGKSVPDLVFAIEQMLDDDFLSEDLFSNSLRAAGYHHTYAEKYDLKFVVRENMLLYSVEDTFPCISRKKQEIHPAVGSISYTLSLSGLDEYAVAFDDFKILLQEIKND